MNVGGYFELFTLSTPYYFRGLPDLKGVSETKHPHLGAVPSANPRGHCRLVRVTTTRCSVIAAPTFKLLDATTAVDTTPIPTARCPQLPPP